MKSQIGRVYILAIALLLFFVLWATVSAHPWSSKAAVDPRVAKLQAREQQVKKEVQRARKVVTARWKNYNRDLQRRQAQIAAAIRRRQAAWSRAMAIARSRRRVVYRTVVGTASAGAGGATGGGGVVVSSGGSGSGGGGGERRRLERRKRLRRRRRRERERRGTAADRQRVRGFPASSSGTS